MLSALITTEHSYPAMLLAEQLVHQRFVHPGPLVTFSYITISVGYIFALLTRLAIYNFGFPIGNQKLVVGNRASVGHRHIIAPNLDTIS